MGKKYSHVKDVSIVGDYRDNGSGWVLLPDHTGAYFIQNVQSSEFMWTLYEQPKGLCLGIVVFKNTLSDDGKRQIEKKSAFYINFVSKNDIELLDSETFLNLKMHKRILTD